MDSGQVPGPRGKLTCSTTVAFGMVATAFLAASMMSARSVPMEPATEERSMLLCTASTAAVTAPHFVWPVMTSTLVRKCVIEYSADPIRDLVTVRKAVSRRAPRWVSPRDEPLYPLL